MDMKNQKQIALGGVAMVAGLVGASAQGSAPLFKIGSVEVRPHATYSVVYDDNIFLEHKSKSIAAKPANNSGRDHDFIHAFTPGLRLNAGDAAVRQSAYFDANYEVAFTSYLGVCGKDYSTKDGILFHNSRTSLADVTDGTSNTLLLGERPPSSDFQFGWWYAGVGQRRTGSADLILGVCEQNLQPIISGSPCGPGAYSFRASQFSDPCGMFHFWSPHSGGANFAIADGSVRFIGYGAAQLLPAIASRAGGETVSVP